MDQQEGKAQVADRITAAARSKTWEECGLEEKVERLRDELRQARAASQAGGALAIELSEAFRNHEHGMEGTPVVPVEPFGMNKPLNALRQFDDLPPGYRRFDPLA